MRLAGALIIVVWRSQKSIQSDLDKFQLVLAISYLKIRFGTIIEGKSKAKLIV